MLRHIFSYFDKSSTFISGVLAIGIYFILLLTLLFYFNTRQAIKPVHYVKKNEDKIRISIASAPTKEKAKTPSEQPAKPKPKKKETAKKQKDTSKKVIKEKVVKKKPKKKEKEKPKPTPKPKKVNKPKRLFENIKTNKPKEKPKKQEKPKPIIKTSKSVEKPKKKSASEMLSESMKEQKASDSGEVSIYKASVTEQLLSWPTQSDFAGESVEIRFVIDKSGRFTFKILKHSSNPSFTNALKIYLKQLQGIGLGHHKRNKPYEFDIEFEATE